MKEQAPLPATAHKLLPFSYSHVPLDPQRFPSLPNLQLFPSSPNTTDSSLINGATLYEELPDWDLDFTPISSPDSTPATPVSAFEQSIARLLSFSPVPIPSFESFPIPAVSHTMPAPAATNGPGLLPLWTIQWEEWPVSHTVADEARVGAQALFQHPGDDHSGRLSSSGGTSPRRRRCSMGGDYCRGGGAARRPGPTEDTLGPFKALFSHKYPVKTLDMPAVHFDSEISDLRQLEDESLIACYRRTVSLLSRVGGRGRPRSMMLKMILTN